MFVRAVCFQIMFEALIFTNIEIISYSASFFLLPDVVVVLLGVLRLSRLLMNLLAVIGIVLGKIRSNVLSPSSFHDITV